MTTTEKKLDNITELLTTLTTRLSVIESKIESLEAIRTTDNTN